MLAFMSASSQEKLPDWVLNPPISNDNSSIYLIGISDPGLILGEGAEQAFARAETFLNPFIQKTESGYQSFRKIGESNETYSKAVNTKMYRKDNFEMISYFKTNYNEVIVLVKYSFIERPTASNADSLQIKTLFNYYKSEMGKRNEVKLEYAARISDNSKKISLNYTFSQKNNIDSLSSYFETKENKLTPKVNGFSNNYPDQFGSEVNPISNQRFNSEGKVNYSLKNGLWPAYLQCFQDATSSINIQFGEAKKSSKNSYTGSMIVIKSLSIENNTLNVTFGGTLFTDGFITKIKP